jgi:hypothetical protein
VIAIRIAPAKEGLGTRVKAIRVTHIVWPSAFLGVLASQTKCGFIGIPVCVTHATADFAAVVVSIVIAFYEGFFPLRIVLTFVPRVGTPELRPGVLEAQTVA